MASKWSGEPHAPAALLGAHWLGGWVGPRAGLDEVAKKWSTCPCTESKPGHPVSRLATILTELPGLQYYVRPLNTA
jgi:hypothetical protein